MYEEQEHTQPANLMGVEDADLLIARANAGSERRIGMTDGEPVAAMVDGQHAFVETSDLSALASGHAPWRGHRL